MARFLGIVFILLLVLTVLPLQVDAGIVQCGITPDDPCEFCDIFKLINNVIIFFLVPSPSVNNMIAVVPLIATLLILVGGFYILIAAGSPERQNTGKSIIKTVIEGLLVVYIAWVVVNSILTFLGVATWTGLTDNPETTGAIEGWWQIQCGI